MIVIFTLLRWLLRASQATTTGMRGLISDNNSKVHPKDVDTRVELCTPQTQLSHFTFTNTNQRNSSEDKRDVYQRQKSSSMDEMNPNRRDKNQLDSPVTTTGSRPTSSNSTDLQLEDRKKSPAKTIFQPKVWGGRVLIILIACGSFYVVTAISLSSESANSWPWGFWYVYALLFDLAFFQPVITFIKFILFFSHIKKPYEGKFKGIARAIIGSDILAIVESKLSLAKDYA